MVDDAKTATVPVSQDQGVGQRDIQVLDALRAEERKAHANLMGVGLACFLTERAQREAFDKARARLAAARSALEAFSRAG